MAFYQPDPSSIGDLYRDQIQDWQNRIRREGWTEGLVDNIVKQCIRISKYKADSQDHWDTPQEFIQKGFKGDCEDIAIFTMYTLKQLNYPHDLRILAVHTLTGDHALLKVRIPGKEKNEWKVYETLPLPLIEFDRLFYRPIVEFDENKIVYYR